MRASRAPDPRPGRRRAAGARRLLRAVVALVALDLGMPALAGGAAPAHAARAPRKVSAAHRARLRQVVHLEGRWLRATSAGEVAPILAADFAEPVDTGRFLDRAGYLAWFAHHPPDPKLRRTYSALKIRLLGETVAVVNGQLDARDAHGRLVRRTVFTDVFQLQDGTWKAVSAQRTRVRLPRHPHRAEH